MKASQVDIVAGGFEIDDGVVAVSFFKPENTETGTARLHTVAVCANNPVKFIAAPLEPVQVEHLGRDAADRISEVQSDGSDAALAETNLNVGACIVFFGDRRDARF